MGTGRLRCPRLVAFSRVRGAEGRSVLPNLLRGGLSASGYAMGDAGMREIGRALSYDDCEPGLTDRQRQALFVYLGVEKSVRHYNKALVREKLVEIRKLAK